jgi:Zn-dependent M28 family amino/carboxypeptidase
MASPPYTSGRGCQAGNINQDGLGYPWTPVNNTLPVFPAPDESISPSLRRAVHAQVRSTPARSNTHPIFQSPSYGMALIPWGVNDKPMAGPGPAITPQNVSWVDWSHSSRCNPTSQGGLQPALSFNSVTTLARTGVEDRNTTGGEDLHACGHTRHTAYV